MASSNHVDCLCVHLCHSIWTSKVDIEGILATSIGLLCSSSGGNVGTVWEALPSAIHFGHYVCRSNRFCWRDMDSLLDRQFDGMERKAKAKRGSAHL